MTRRKVLFIHHGGGIGGAPVSMLQLAAALDRSRYEPLAVFTRPGPILDFAHHLGVPARVVSMRSAFFYSAHVPVRLRMLAPFLLHFWPSVQAAGRLMRQERPDLVHLNTSVLVPAAIGIRREGIPLIWHVREVPGPNPMLRRWQTGTISRLADVVIANSNFVRQAFPPGTRVEVVHNAVDLQRFEIDQSAARRQIRAELDLPTDALVVGMIGSVQAVKGHYLLVEAARQVVRAVPSVRFLIVAGGVGAAYARSWKGRVKRTLGLPFDNLERMQRQIAGAGLQQHFVFTGYRSDIPEVLAAVDVVAFLPQAAEGFGRPLIEAMAMGRPVVATDIGPTKEILDDDTGILVAPGDAHEVASALTILLRDAELRQRLGEAGQRRVAARFTLDKAVEATHNLYSDLLARALS